MKFHSINGSKCTLENGPNRFMQRNHRNFQFTANAMNHFETEYNIDTEYRSDPLQWRSQTKHRGKLEWLWYLNEKEMNERTIHNNSTTTEHNDYSSNVSTRWIKRQNGLSKAKKTDNTRKLVVLGFARRSCSHMSFSYFNRIGNGVGAVHGRSKRARDYVASTAAHKIDAE